MLRMTVLLLPIVVVGCSDDTSVSTCVPGTSAACACPDGTTGAQVCTSDGTFEPCSCGAGMDAGPRAPDAGEGTDAGEPGDAGAEDAGSDGDAGVEVDGGPASACYDPGASLLLRGSTVEVDQGVCTDADVVAVRDCLVGGSIEDECETLYGLGSPLDPSAPRHDCADCLVPTGAGADTVPAAGSLSDGTLVLNTLACQAAADGRAECAASIGRRIFCAQTACETCEASDLSECIDVAATGICEEIELSDPCAAYLDSAEPGPDCSGDTFMDGFVNIGTYFCAGGRGG